MTNTRRSFPNETWAPRAARRFALASLPAYPDVVLEKVELLVSELTTNCVCHTDSGFEVRVSADPERIRVAVTDHGSGRPEVQPFDPSATSGRGLALVKLFSSSSGVRRSRSLAGGKTVWFVIELSKRRSHSPSVARAAEHSRGQWQGAGRPRRLSDPPPERLRHAALTNPRRPL
jgi:anti-sigma regulatory factor (Ser/Thr protein kinase)